MHKGSYKTAQARPGLLITWGIGQLGVFKLDRVADMKKYISFTGARIKPKLVYPKSEFAIKQGKMYLTTTMRKIGPPHNYRGNNNVIN